MDGVAHIVQPAEKNDVSISHFEITDKEQPDIRKRAKVHGMDFLVPNGKYCRLIVGDDLMMSDTPMERKSNRVFAMKAHGNVLIAGLGIGLIINAILKKDNTVLQSITIVEKSQDVIDLVSPYYQDPRIEYVHADIMTWEPPKGIKYDVIYFDIWLNIDPDNLEEITALHERFKNKLNRKNRSKWMGSWMHDRVKRMKKAEDRFEAQLLRLISGGKTTITNNHIELVKLIVKQA